jgi:hypothetical protein
MSTIDKQRIAAVRKLEELGYTFAAGDWMHPTDGASPAPAITDALHALLVKRADDLEGCTEGSGEERELAAICRLGGRPTTEEADHRRWRLLRASSERPTPRTNKRYEIPPLHLTLSSHVTGEQDIRSGAGRPGQFLHRNELTQTRPASGQNFETEHLQQCVCIGLWNSL